MKRHMIHIITPHGIEGWIPDPHRWDGVKAVVIVLVFLGVGWGIGWLMGIEHALGWAR